MQNSKKTLFGKLVSDELIYRLAKALILAVIDLFDGDDDDDQKPKK